jgi:antitoxin ParD1/3/4
MHESDTLLEQWLREEVVPVYERMKAEPARAIPMGDIFAQLRAAA